VKGAAVVQVPQYHEPGAARSASLHPPYEPTSRVLRLRDRSVQLRVSCRARQMAARSELLTTEGRRVRKFSRGGLAGESDLDLSLASRANPVTAVTVATAVSPLPAARGEQSAGPFIAPTGSNSLHPASEASNDRKGRSLGRLPTCTRRRALKLRPRLGALTLSESHPFH
jgi:hypothetical protein